MRNWHETANRWRLWRYVAWCALLVSLWIALMAYLADVYAFGPGKLQILQATYLAIPTFAVAVAAVVLTTVCEKRAEFRALREEEALRDAAARQPGGSRGQDPPSG